MEKIMGLYGLCIQLFTLLHIEGIQGSTRLDSLTCANNFKTYWICYWKESAEMNKMLPMNLYYRNNISGNQNQLCSPDNPQKQEDGLFHMSCNFSDTFGSVTGTFTFQPKWTVQAKTHIIPSGVVRIPTPEDLIVHRSNNGLIILTWKMPKYAPSPDSLTFQVTYYRKDWETFQDAVSITVLGKMEVGFNPKSFATGSTYLFRVRSVPYEDPVYRSTWSKELAWTISEDQGAIAQNLHCEYDGFMEMRCSWELRKELVSSVSYALYYTKSSEHREESCLGKLNTIKDGLSHVQYICTLQVPPLISTYSFNIQLRPVEEVKTLKADENIQLEPPLDLRIKDHLNQGYILNWSPSTVQFSTIQIMYQLCYWKQGDPECPSHSLANVSNNLLEYYIPLSELEGSTNYTAKVRAKPDEEFLYNGPWSAWSKRCSWKTHKAGSSENIYTSAIIISMVLSVFVFLGCRSYKRLKRKWDESIPNPSKSKLLLGYRSTIINPFIHQNFYGEEEQASICVPVSSINTVQMVAQPEEQLMSENASNPLGPYSLVPLTEKNMPCQFSCNSQDKKTNDITEIPTVELIKGPSSKNSNGPYMMDTCDKSMSDFLTKQVANQSYVSIPRCQEELFNLPKEVNKLCQPPASKDPMGYVCSMENPVSIQEIQDPESKNVSDNSKYFAIPLPSDFHLSPEGPVMIINPDGSGPLLLKQVGDYCFFPVFHGSQENIEQKETPSSGQKHQEVPRVQPLPALSFKVMQRGYFALPQI